MPIFKGKEFVSPLQQHWHTPKLRVVFLSILWRFSLRGLFLFHSQWFLQNILFLQTWRKCLNLKVIRFFSPLQQHWHTPKLRVVFLSILWRFYRGICLYFIHTGFYKYFIPKNMAKMPIFKGKSLFLHFSSTDIHQNLELYSSLYYEGFTWGICLYFIHTGFYNILFLQTWRKCLYLKVIRFFLHFSSTDIHQNVELYFSLYSEGFYLGICLYFIHTGFYKIFYS